jgi:exodeoxyribonuclease V beta subunit
MNGPHQHMSTDNAENLDPLRLPLHGSRLIEASAGTGKTFTIAMLYLRLVLGHGGKLAYRTRLLPKEILVSTFTNAATKELRSRIQTRLTEAATYFLEHPDSASARLKNDEMLHALRSDYPRETWADCARRLTLARDAMDDSAVCTIHSWCQRMLREHAFDTGSLFTQALQTNAGDLVAEIARDYWRCHIAPLDAESAREVAGWWSSPGNLLEDLKTLLSNRYAIDDAKTPEQALRENLADREHYWRDVKAPWPAWTEALQKLLVEANEKGEVGGIKRELDWLEDLRLWANGTDQCLPKLGEGWRRVSDIGFAKRWEDKGIAAAPQHPALTAIHALANSRFQDARNDILRHAATWIGQRVRIESAHRAELSSDDLLRELDIALQGPNGGNLAARIREQFPVAMLDEFQDTDPVQYRIFDAVYRVADNDPACALILIGDPKQAIYSFRGADIYSYLHARASTEGRLYTLKKNFRSTTEMVAATNRLFHQAEQRVAGSGAFMFRDAEKNRVPFVEADARGRAERLIVGGVPATALTAWWIAAEDGNVILVDDHLAKMSAVCADRIAHLLHPDLAAVNGFQVADDPDASLKPIRPADIAVLVSNFKEAASIRAALESRGVRSVYLSDKESVFETAHAKDLQHWLAACAEPANVSLLRSALGTRTLGLGLHELDMLNHDERAWDARARQFHDYQACWRKQGVLPMLRRLMGHFKLPEKLLAGADRLGGERILTDLLHIAEFLQQASQHIEGEQSLVRHLAEQRQAGESDGDDVRKMRLESDAHLVRVITIHKAKGMEYSLVFLPYPSACRPSKKDDQFIWHDALEQRRFHVDADETGLSTADRERLGEDIRKLYVALTRARYATWIGVAATENLNKSAIAYLLNGEEAMNLSDLDTHLSNAIGRCSHIAIAPVPVSGGPLLRLDTNSSITVGLARRMTRAVNDHWWIASYSHLKAKDAFQLPEPAQPDDDVSNEMLVDQEFSVDALAAAITTSAPPAPVAAASIGPLHDLPRGADVGNILHDLLEQAAAEGFDQVAADTGRIHGMVADRCQASRLSGSVDTVATWLRHLLQLPLPLPPMNGAAVAPVALADLHAVACEMEFWIAADHVDVSRLDRLVCTHIAPGLARPSLPTAQIHGMLKGFIDLMFEHEGRYYVLDYKSNYLGPDDAAYTQEKMQAAMLKDRYELQYVLYTFALHRLLTSRLPDYDYDVHVGGIAYVFLRGTHGSERGVYIDRPPRALIETIDTLFSQASAEASV